MPIHHQLLALLVAFIWGTNFVFIEIGLAELPPFLFACLRFLLAALPLIFILPRPQVSWLALASYGFFIGFGQFGLLFWVMQDHLSPGLASLIIQVQAMLTILLALLLLNERIKPLQVLALIVSMVGIGVIALNRGGDASLIGLGVILIAACSWAAGNLVVKRIGKVSIIAFLAWSSLFAVPPLLAMSWYLEGPQLMQTSITNAGLVSWSVLLWQTIGNTLIGYGLWNWLLHRHAAALVTPWALMVPVFGMWASSLALDEAMPMWKILAATLIISGLLLNLRATQAPQ